MNQEGQTSDMIISDSSIQNDSRLGLMTKGLFFENKNQDEEIKLPQQNKYKKKKEIKQLSQQEIKKKQEFSLSPYKQEQSKKAVQLLLFNKSDNPQKKQNSSSDQQIQIKKSRKGRKAPFAIYFQSQQNQQKNNQNQQKNKRYQYQEQTQQIQNIQQNKIQQQNYSRRQQNDELQEIKEQRMQYSVNQQLDQIQLQQDPFKRVYLSIPRGKPSTFLLKKSQSIFNKINPVFHLYFKNSGEHYISAKQTSNNTTSTFIISFNKKDFTENGPNYIGKVKSNFIGNLVNIYGPGYNPKDVKNSQKLPRQLIATINYETNFFGSRKPRNFLVYNLKDQVSYNNNLYGVKIGQQEIGLNQLYQNDNNKNNINVYKTRKPQWQQDLRAHVLDFNGRVNKASVKNFILQHTTIQNKQALVFGKVTDQQFILDITSKISPIVALGIALSQFQNKIGCE